MDREKHNMLLLLCFTGLCVCMLVISGLVGGGYVFADDYISFEYSGANGYASVECIFDSEKLYDKLSEKETDQEKLEAYKKFADSFKAVVGKENISNGDSLSVYVVFDEKMARQLGLKVCNFNYRTRAKGIAEGKSVNLFENVAIVFAGPSPTATVKIRNNWEDEYLSTLEFRPSKSINITSNETISVECSDSYADLAKHGYLPQSMRQYYTAEYLDSYVASTQNIDREILKKIISDCEITISSETYDKSFRMMYRATGKEEYLYMLNEEEALNIRREDMYFLKVKEDAINTTDNYIYLVFSAVISNTEASEDVYFAFELQNSVTTIDGDFKVDYQQLEKKYYCNSDKTVLYENCIGNKSEIYDILTFTD